MYESNLSVFYKSKNTIFIPYNIGDKFGSLNIGPKINTIDGLKSISFNYQYKLGKLKANSGISSLINTESYTPSLPYRFKSYSYTYNAKIGLENKIHILNSNMAMN